MRYKYYINLKDGIAKKMSTDNEKEYIISLIKNLSITKDLVNGIDISKLHTKLQSLGINVVTIRGDTTGMGKPCFSCEIVVDNDGADYSDTILTELKLLKERI